MAIELNTITIAELHKQLQAYIDQGLGDVPVVATDCRGCYPFQAYTVLDQSGYTDALMLYVRPDAHFAQRNPLPLNWGPSRVAEWNAEADRVRETCGAFHGIAGSKPKAVWEALERLVNVVEVGTNADDVRDAINIARAALAFEAPQAESQNVSNSTLSTWVFPSFSVGK